MKTLVALAVAAGIAGLAHAHPLVIEETSLLPAPPDVEGYGSRSAIDGSDAVTVGIRSIPDTEGNDDLLWTAHLYRRSGSAWTYVRKLDEWLDANEDDASTQAPVAMKNGVLMATASFRIFERENGAWAPKTVDFSGGGGEAPPSDLEIDGGRIFVGTHDWGGTLYERSAAGVWRASAEMHGDWSGNGDNAVGGPVALAPNWAAVASPYNADDLPGPAVQVFQRVSGVGWPLNARLVMPEGHAVGDVAIRDDELFIGDYARHGTGVWRRDSAGQWYVADRLRTASDFDNAGPFDGQAFVGRIVKGDTFMLKEGWNAERGAPVIDVFTSDAGGKYRHVAQLVARNGAGFGLGSPGVSGRSVIAGTRYFELPASFEVPALCRTRSVPAMRRAGAACPEASSRCCRAAYRESSGSRAPRAMRARSWRPMTGPASPSRPTSRRRP